MLSFSPSGRSWRRANGGRLANAIAFYRRHPDEPTGRTLKRSPMVMSTPRTVDKILSMAGTFLMGFGGSAIVVALYLMMRR
jgi:hypothetical protein